MWALLRKPMGVSAFMGFAMWSPVPGLPHPHCGSQTSPFTHSDASGPGHTETLRRGRTTALGDRLVAIVPVFLVKKRHRASKEHVQGHRS